MSDTNDQTDPQADQPKTMGAVVPPQALGEAAGDVIDRYRLLEEIGEGGMGTVWLAQQSEPVKRRVALKIIKLGMDTREVVTRFEVERQALALMDHPHIAKVLDAGATSSGRPFFVMELVHGIPITEYCDQAKLGLRARLELFTKVCRAIQHAHNKGIIHRDVKPSNTLVALQDGVPAPKVIDFGIAKATSAELTQDTLFTRFAQVMGTPEYMAPEQAESGRVDIDTRVDIYSLGVLLYELLTGTKPFDFQKSLTNGFVELMRTIREEDPAKPSTRISTLGESQPAIAERRRVNMESLCKRLRGDLDWIVMKALEKDRTRRYETADGFAADIEHYLNHEEVQAAPPSLKYRLSKLLRRHRKLVASLVLIGVLLFAGTVGTGLGWWKTMQANRRLDVALADKVNALDMEAEQRLLAETNAQRAQAAEAQALEEAQRASEAEATSRLRADELEQVAAFQAEQLADLDVELMGTRMQRAFLEAAPEELRGQLAPILPRMNFTNLALGTLRENLFERTVAAIDAQFVGQPLVQAQLLQSTAETLQELGLFELASDPAQRALSLRRSELGDAHPESLASIGLMGALLLDQGKLQEAEDLCREALEGRRRALGDQHPETLDSINRMGLLLQAQGLLSDAQPLLREALAGRRSTLGIEHEDTLTSLNNLGGLLQLQGKLEEAEPYYREALQGSRRLLGDDHPDTLTSLSNMGDLLSELGQQEAAEPYLREALDSARRVRGDAHPDTLTLINNMGALLRAQGKLELAEPYFREALAGFRSVLGDEHPGTLSLINNMGVLLTEQGELAAAEPFCREAFEGCLRILGAEHSDTLFSQASYERLLRARLKAAREAGSSLQEGDALHALGNLQRARGRHADAENLLAEALDLFLSQAPAGDVRPWQTQVDLGWAIAGQARLAEAEAVLLEGALWLLENPGAQGLDSGAKRGREVLQQLSDFYQALHAQEPSSGYDLKRREWEAKLEAKSSR